MAKIGLENFLYGVLTENGSTATYGVAKKPGKAVSCNVSISSNDAKLYADDSLAESDTSFQSGTQRTPTVAPPSQGRRLRNPAPQQ